MQILTKLSSYILLGIHGKGQNHDIYPVGICHFGRCSIYNYRGFYYQILFGQHIKIGISPMTPPKGKH